MADQTLRYRAATRVSYSHGLIALVEYSREHPEPDFVFGPLTLGALESQGLVLSGTDLDGPAGRLSAVAGLTETPA